MMKNPKNPPNSKQDYREKIHTPQILWNMRITRENKTLETFKEKKKVTKRKEIKEVTKNETQFRINLSLHNAYKWLKTVK